MREQWSGRRRSRAVDQADAGGAATQPGPSVASEQGQESTGVGLEKGHEDAEAARAGEEAGAAEAEGETAVLTQRAQQAVQLTAMLDQAQDYARLSRAANTQRAYRADWADFSAWCASHGRPALPATPQTVLLYLTDAAERCKVSTLQRRLTTISQAHKAERHPSPTGDPAVRAVWAGIKRTKGTAPHGKTAAVTEDLRRMVRALPQTSTIRKEKPRPTATGLRRRLPPLRAGWPRHRRCGRHRRRVGGHPAPLQDRSGGSRAHCGHPLRFRPDHLPGTGDHWLDLSGGSDDGAAVPEHYPPWQGAGPAL